MKQFNHHSKSWGFYAQRVYKHDNTCACCGVKLLCSIGDPSRPSDGEHQGSALHIYHLDGDRSNLARWNLVQLCRQCADGTDIVVMHKPLMFAPATWLMPHIAGWIETHRNEFVSLPARYDLAKWITQYRRETKRHWPAGWAPIPTTYDEPPRMRLCYYPLMTHLASKEAYHAHFKRRAQATSKATAQQSSPQAA